MTEERLGVRTRWDTKREDGEFTQMMLLNAELISFFFFLYGVYFFSFFFFHSLFIYFFKALDQLGAV